MQNKSGETKPSSWALRVVTELVKSGNLELEDDYKLEDIVPEVMAALDDHGEQALASREACDELADVLAEVDGVAELYATERELQEILRKTIP